MDDCLQWISAGPGDDLEIIVVDNASTDDSSSMAENKYHYVKLIENNENADFAKANNQGFQENTGKYVMYLNGDTIVKPQNAREDL